MTSCLFPVGISTCTYMHFVTHVCVYSHIVFCIVVYNFHMCMCMLICTCAFTYICAGKDRCTSIFYVAPHFIMHILHHAPCMLHALCNRHVAICRIRIHMRTHTQRSWFALATGHRLAKHVQLTKFPDVMSLGIASTSARSRYGGTTTLSLPTATVSPTVLACLPTVAVKFAW